MKTDYKTILIIVVAIMIMTLNFSYNIFIMNSKERNEFRAYQIDSENLVIGGIIRDRKGLKDVGYGLQRIKDIDAYDYEKYKELLQSDEKIETMDYKSQVGIQGRIFSFLYNKLHIPIAGLHLLCSFLLAIVIVTICFLLKEKYGKLFAGVFFAVFLLSPWITQFAKNLYWVEFTWFLPLMLCLLLAKTKNIKLYLPLIFLAVLFKCLCGYEYLSTILLTSITFFILDFILKKEERKENFKMILLVGIVSVLAFIVALCIHANIRGDGNIIQGIQTIIKEDVMRRTMGNQTEQFDNPLIKRSIEASYLETIKKYYNFYTDIILGIEGKLFPTLCITSFFIAIYNISKKKENAKRDMILYCMFFLSTMSWFILGKAHSYIHVVMNFVLWYFGYIQMVFYIIIKFILQSIHNIRKEELE